MIELLEITSPGEKIFIVEKLLVGVALTRSVSSVYLNGIFIRGRPKSKSRRREMRVEREGLHGKSAGNDLSNAWKPSSRRHTRHTARR